eukprot:INCI15847.1.p1 GENE.INCI15847.1~~INCI15847.1.p1  ORF type:complete len:1883 (+),score=262.33 INCI15847.1:304-5952(+)
MSGLGCLNLAFYDKQRLWMNGVSGTFHEHFQKGIELVTRSSERRFVKRVQFLSVSSADLMSPADSSSSDNWYRCPYVHVIVVRSQNLQDYRQNTRSYIKHLVDGFERQNLEWCIMYVNTNKHIPEPTRLADLEEQRKVFKTVQKAFCARDTGEVRCFWLDISAAKDCPSVLPISKSGPNARSINSSGTSTSGSTSINTTGGGGANAPTSPLDEANSKDQALRDRILMDAVSRTFQRRRKKYEREIEILREGIENETWDFCRFFVTCESFAKMFERVHLFEDALLIYDMLENVNRARKDSRGQWMKGKVLACQNGSNILKPLTAQRTQIQNYSITRADFMQYLFARQCHLLLCSGDVSDLAEIADRARKFICRFGPVLETTMFKKGVFPSAHDVDVWLYAATLAVAEKCHKQLAKIYPQTLDLLAPKRTTTVHDFSLERDIKRAHTCIAALFRMAMQRMFAIGGEKLQKLQHLQRNVPTFHNLLGSLSNSALLKDFVMEADAAPREDYAIHGLPQSARLELTRLSLEIADDLESALWRCDTIKCGPIPSATGKPEPRAWRDIRPNCRIISSETPISEMEDFYLHFSVLAVAHDRAAGLLNTAMHAEQASIRLLMAKGRFSTAQATLVEHSRMYDATGWKKMALFCRVLYAQCALKVYEQFHRKQQQRARLHAARADRPLVSAGAVQTAEKDARLSRSSSDSNVAAMPGRTRHARSSSAGGVGGTDHAFHDALWAVFDVLISCAEYFRELNPMLPNIPCEAHAEALSADVKTTECVFRRILCSLTRQNLTIPSFTEVPLEAVLQWRCTGIAVAGIDGRSQSYSPLGIQQRTGSTLNLFYGDTVSITVGLSEVASRPDWRDPLGDRTSPPPVSLEDFAFELVIVADKEHFLDGEGAEENHFTSGVRAATMSTTVNQAEAEVEVAAAAAMLPPDVSSRFRHVHGWTLRPKLPPKAPLHVPEPGPLQLGQIVWVAHADDERARGIVRFVGNVSFADGVWVGIELETATGFNNGSINGRVYFDCPQQYGVFVLPEKVTQVQQSPWPLPHLPITELTFTARLEAPDDTNLSRTDCCSFFLRAKLGRVSLRSKLWRLRMGGMGLPSDSLRPGKFSRKRGAALDLRPPVLFRIERRPCPCAVNLTVAPLCSPGQPSFVDVNLHDLRRDPVFCELASSFSNAGTGDGSRDNPIILHPKLSDVEVALELRIAQTALSFAESDTVDLGDGSGAPETMTLFMVPDNRQLSVVQLFNGRATHTSEGHQCAADPSKGEWASLDDLVGSTETCRDEGMNSDEERIGRPTPQCSVFVVDESCVLPFENHQGISSKARAELEVLMLEQLAIFQGRKQEQQQRDQQQEQYESAVQSPSKESARREPKHNLASSLRVKIPGSVLSQVFSSSASGGAAGSFELAVRVPFYVFNLKGKLLKNVVFPSVPRAQARVGESSSAPGDRGEGELDNNPANHHGARIEAKVALRNCRLAPYFSDMITSNAIIAQSPLRARMIVNELDDGHRVVCQVFLQNVSDYCLHIAEVDLKEVVHQSTSAKCDQRKLASLSDQRNARLEPNVLRFPRYVIQPWESDPNRALVGHEILPQQQGALLFRLNIDGESVDAKESPWDDLRRASPAASGVMATFHQLSVQYTYSVSDGLPRLENARTAGGSTLQQRSDGKLRTEVDGEQLPWQSWKAALGIFPLGVAQHYHHFLAEQRERESQAQARGSRPSFGAASPSGVGDMEFGLRSHVATLDAHVDRMQCCVGELVHLTYVIDASLPTHFHDADALESATASSSLLWSICTDSGKWVVTGTTRAHVTLEDDGPNAREKRSIGRRINVELGIRAMEPGWLPLPLLELYEFGPNDTPCRVTLSWRQSAVTKIQVIPGSVQSRSLFVMNE